MRDLSHDSVHLFVKDDVQLFVDNVLIESSQDLTRVYHQPERVVDEPVIKRDRPWEHILYFTYSNHQVLRDPEDGLFKCWYEDLQGPDSNRSSHHFNMFSKQLYAESEDGIHWVKPELDVYKHNEVWTNIVMGDDEYGQVHSAGYVIDPNPPTANERYRAIFAHYWDRDSDHGDRIECAHSPDGKHWHVYDKLPSFGRCGPRIGDVSTLYYDYDARDFIQITRHFLQSSAPANPTNSQNPVNRASFNKPHEPHNFASYSQRRLWMTRSNDFLHWSEPIVIAAADDEEDNLDESFYGMPMFKVGNVFFGTVGVLHQVDNCMDVQLMMSRDMVRWKRVAKRAPFLSPRGTGYWDGRMVSAVSAPIEVGNELWFYHGGTAYHHDWFLRGHIEGLVHEEAKHPEKSDFGLGLVKLRKDGFAGVRANALREGILCTHALSGVGDRLVINAACGSEGSIRVEIVDSGDRIVPGCSREKCDPFVGDSIDHAVTWKGNDTIPLPRDGRGLGICKIRFFIKNAELFSFRFENV